MEVDVIIVGGGMVGAALASALCDSPLQVALIDASPKPSDDQQDKRFIALTQTNCDWFKNLPVNLWGKLQPFAEPIQKIHVSKQGAFGSTLFDAKEVNLTELGYVIPANQMNHVLYEYLHQYDNVHLLRPATLETLSQTSNQVTTTVTMATNTLQVTGRILIGADGIHSTVRRLLAIETESYDYQQSAIVTHTGLTRSHNNIAYERFQNKGAIAMLPLKGLSAATIWSSDNTTVKQLMALSDQDYLAALQQHFGYHLGLLQTTSQRAVYPLTMLRATQSRQQNCMLIGNAAHMMHPIAAQGLNLSLMEVSALASHLRQQTIDQLSLTGLARHAQEKTSMRLSHQVARIFSTDFFPANIARQLGFIGLDIIPPLKRRFMRHALGTYS